MFKFLKDKLKAAVSTFTKKAAEPKEEEKSFEQEAISEKDIKSELVVEESKIDDNKTVPPEEKNIEQDQLMIDVEEAHIEDENHAIESSDEIVEFHMDDSKPHDDQEELFVDVENDNLDIEDKKIHDEPVEEFITIEPEKVEPKNIRTEKIHEIASEKPSKEKIVVRAAETEEKIEKKGFFSRLADSIKKTTISEKKFEELFWDIELVLLENNVAVEVIDKIKNDLMTAIVDTQINRSDIEKKIISTLKQSIESLFEEKMFDVVERTKNKKPFVICFVGINGSGKTTTIAKFARMFLDEKKKVVLAAADTFRAAAIDQLQLHADKLQVKLIRHDYGSDPAAVAFDAIKHAEAKNVDVVLIDTAGRMHSNSNLMDEMKKIIRVSKPDLKIFIGESITGNDCVEQARSFNAAIGIDGIVLSKADIDEKGGAAISVSYVTKKPILYIGTGQDYSDLKKFSPKIVIDSLGL